MWRAGITVTVLTLCCVLDVHAQQLNNQLGGIPQNFQNGATNINGLNTFPGPGVRPGTNVNLQGNTMQGAANNFGAGRGFSSPFGSFGPGRMQLGFRSRFSRPGVFPGRAMPPMSPMAMMMMSMTRNPNNYRYATCIFNDTSSTVKGRADFRQFLIGEGREQVNIRIQLSGLPQAMSDVERGMHVHEFGDIGDGCARVGPHFNPNQTPHGSQRNFAFLRHVGDLGNIRQSMDGLVSTQFIDSVISLEGMNSIVGRALVIKLERDDLGQGNNRESQVDGNTQNPIACCTIGRTTPRHWYNPMTAQDIQNMASTGLMPDATRNDFSNMNMNTMNMNTMNSMNNMNTNGNNPNMRPGMNGPVLNQNNFGPTFNAPGPLPNNPNGNMNNFNGQPGMANFNPQSGINNFVPNMNRRQGNLGSGTFFPGAMGQTLNLNNQGKRK